MNLNQYSPDVFAYTHEKMGNCLGFFVVVEIVVVVYFSFSFRALYTRRLETVRGQLKRKDQSNCSAQYTHFSRRTRAIVCKQVDEYYLPVQNETRLHFGIKQRSHFKCNRFSFTTRIRLTKSKCCHLDISFSQLCLKL